MRNISLETTALNGAIEWRQGTNLNHVLQDKSFRGIDRIAKELLKLCQIKAMKRAGIRLFCLDSYVDGKHGGLGRFASLLDSSFRRQSAEILGTLDDIGVVLEGTTMDKVSYRAHFGPFAKKNVDQVLEIKPNEADLKALGEPDLFFDIDLFESNISFTEHSLFR
jgi:hypothetical protein